MKTRVSIAAMLALLSAFLMAPAAHAGRRARPTCYPAHSRTLLATAQARVFETRTIVEHAHVTYGCLLHRRRPVRFYLPDFPLGFGPIVLAGPYVAYGDYSDCAASFCDPNSVVVQDLRTGHVSFVDGSIRIADVKDLVLEPSGSLAWISSAYDESGSPLPGLQVAAVEHGGAPVILDSGSDIVPGSLALAGSTLYWTKGTTPQSAALG